MQNTFSSMRIMLESMQILQLMYGSDRINSGSFCLTFRFLFCMMEPAEGRERPEIKQILGG